jgi:hypothetical protein
MQESFFNLDESNQQESLFLVLEKNLLYNVWNRFHSLFKPLSWNVVAGLCLPDPARWDRTSHDNTWSLKITLVMLGTMELMLVLALLPPPVATIHAHLRIAAAIHADLWIAATDIVLAAHPAHTVRHTPHAILRQVLLI